MIERSSILTFANTHANDDPNRLCLWQERYPDIDLGKVAQQLEGRKQAKTKWPWLADINSYWYPPRLNREQSSSEATARYKSETLIPIGCKLIDLTGGMGIDCALSAPRCSQVDYIDINPELCENMAYNCQVLGLRNVRCHCADSIEWIEQQQLDSNIQPTVIYVDPARRDARGNRVAAFEDSIPNILPRLAMIMGHCDKLIIKASPMIDIAAARKELSNYLTEIHIVALHNECKEILFVCQQQPRYPYDSITCVDLPRQPITFDHATDACIPTHYCNMLAQYLYEPNAALMKSGLYHSIGQQYAVEEIDRNSHLYTHPDLIKDFPGRIFQVIQEVKLNAKSVRQVMTAMGDSGSCAHVITRNYPAAAAVLQKQLKLREGGSLFIIATTMQGKKIGVLCRQIL
ncbi:MAG: hypothetical protein KBT04_04775 [Bacteroidales bacterium]|nr:hypothetical protein [Candidatus Colimorpha onthohippi]